VVFALALISACGMMPAANPNRQRWYVPITPPLGGATLVLLLAVVFVTAFAA